MKKLFYLCLLLCFCTLYGCGHCSCQETEVAKEEDVTIPMYLELVFGNGERLTAEVDYFLIPYSSGSLGRFDFFEEANRDANPFVVMLETELLIELSKKGTITLSSAVFMDGTEYSFHEAKNHYVNKETKTITVELWRDEPSASELDFFSQN